MKSPLIDSLRDDLQALVKSGAVDKITLREFDQLCPPQVTELDPGEIKALRERFKISQAVFALYLHTTASTVQKWERGESRPAGPALKLLNLVAQKGLNILA
ncbi:helix-turn-helix domain-containing protein [Alcaligenes sp. WGS1538]|uniref:helix-turn-helix domain-containing protein n=1 Tax=Alcaligenes sp. WGS1538 TaxID=3366811 RepID=UPI00372D4FF0